jgi:hypothetical protein
MIFARNELLEEAAKVADAYAEKAWAATDIAADIRALKSREITPKEAMDAMIEHGKKFLEIDEVPLGQRPRWTDGEHKNALRCCPTCGTPAFSHPDRIRGEDALPIPPEALALGVRVLQNMVRGLQPDIAEMTVEAIFREMLQERHPR